MQYQRSKDYGVERAAMHIRNVSPVISVMLLDSSLGIQVGAKILGQKLKNEQEKDDSDS